MSSDSPITQTRLSRSTARRLELAVQTLGFKGHDKKMRATDHLLTEAMNAKGVPPLAATSTDPVTAAAN